MSQYRDSFMLVEEERGKESKHKGYNGLVIFENQRQNIIKIKI